MRNWLLKLIDTTAMMRTRRATSELLALLTRELGFDYYQALNVRYTGLGNVMLSNAPEKWPDMYLQRRFDRIDPILARARDIMAPFVWDIEQEGQVAREDQATFFAIAHKAGIRAGICMPVMTPLKNFFTVTLFTRDLALPYKYQLLPVLSANAVALLQVCVETNAVASEGAPAIELTGRQAMVLKWVAEGKTLKEIAVLEGLTHHTVNFHMKNIRRKLDTVTLPQTTALATKLNLI